MYRMHLFDSFLYYFIGIYLVLKRKHPVTRNAKWTSFLGKKQKKENARCGEGPIRQASIFLIAQDAHDDDGRLPRPRAHPPAAAVRSEAAATAAARVRARRAPPRHG